MRIISFVLVSLLASAGAQDFSGQPKVSDERMAANAALEARDYAKAAALLGPLALATPKDEHVLYDLGSSLDALEQSAAAEESYRAAIVDDGTFSEPRVALGLLLARAGKLTEAREELAAAAALPGEATLRARAYRTLARLDETARPGDARDELLEALKLTPETPEDTLLSAELAQSATGGAGAAEAAYRRVLIAQPNDAEATAGLARLLVQQKHAGEAELLLSRGLAAHPGDPGLTVQLASTLTADGKPALALPPVEALATAHPDDQNIARLLAGLYVDAQKWPEAAPLLLKLNAADSADARTADDLGVTLLHLKRFAEAEAVLSKIVMQPTRFQTPASLGDAAGHLAFAASENNDPVEALRAIALRATVLPKSPVLLFVAAVSYDRLHQGRQAADAYQEFLAASNGENPDQEFEARHRLIALAHRK